MSSKKPLYIICVMLFAIAMTLPQLAFIYVELVPFIRNSMLSGTVRINQIRGLRIGTMPYRGRLTNAEFWQDRFLYSQQSSKTPKDQGWDLTIWSFDPGTGDLADLGWKVPSDYSQVPMASGTRLWLANRTETSQVSNMSGSKQRDGFEMVDGEMRPYPFPSYVAKSPHGWHQRQWMVLDGNPAIIEPSDDGFLVSTLKNGSWDAGRYLVLPAFDRTWTFPSPDHISPLDDIDAPIQFISFRGASSIQVLTLNNQFHTFIQLDGRTLYRAGLDLWPESATKLSWEPLIDRQIACFSPSKEPASALRLANADTEIAP